jgi:hypothetical protein
MKAVAFYHRHDLELPPYNPKFYCFLQSIEFIKLKPLNYFKIAKNYLKVQNDRPDKSEHNSRFSIDQVR